MDFLNTIEGNSNDLSIVEAIGQQNKLRIPPNKKLSDLISRVALEKLQDITEDLIKKTPTDTEKIHNIEKGSKLLQKELLSSWCIDNNLQDVQAFLDHPRNHSLITTDLLSSCQSKEMIQLLVKYGCKIEDLEPSLVSKLCTFFVQCDKLDLLDCCAKFGMKIPIQTVRGNKIYFNDRVCIAGYRNHPHIKKAFHQFIQDQLKRDNDSDVWKGLLYCCVDGDSELILMVLEQLKNSSLFIEYNKFYDFTKLIHSAIQNGNTNVVEALFNYINPAHCPVEQQQKMWKNAEQIGHIAIGKMLIMHGVKISNHDQQVYVNQKTWFDNFDNTYTSYKPLERALDAKHQAMYGESVQDKFNADARQNVAFALWAMNAKKRGETFAPSFHDLMIALGNRRKQTAYACNSPGANEFGTEKSVEVYTKIKGPYAAYSPRAKVFDVKITIDEKPYLLTTCRRDEWEHSVYGLTHCYLNFWKKDDPVFKQVEQLYDTLVSTTYDDVDALTKDIGTFHWLLANIVPFERGSAACTEFMTDALWLHHGYLPQTFEKGKSLDLEALFSPKIEDFLAIYPKGISLPKISS
jgi:hypothetical protein